MRKNRPTNILFALICIVFSVELNANFSPSTIANELKIAAKIHKIDSKILYTLAKIESNFTPLVITFTHTNPNIKFKNLTKKTQKYKNKYLISLYGNESDLRFALKILLAKNIRVDIGLMQINSQNLVAKDLDFIFHPRINIAHAIRILKNCQNAKRTTKATIECYNKGLRQAKKFNYYDKFARSFVKDFGSVK